MRILLDENIPKELAGLLTGHQIEAVHSLGWHTVKNGELLERARAEFDALITCDRGILFQHAHTGQKLCIVVLRGANNKLVTLSKGVPAVLDFLETAQAGATAEIPCG